MQIILSLIALQYDDLVLHIALQLIYCPEMQFSCWITVITNLLHGMSYVLERLRESFTFIAQCHNRVQNGVQNVCRIEGKSAKSNNLYKN